MTSRLARFFLTLLLALLTAAAATFGAAAAWRAIGGAAMSVHGWVALGLGMVGSVALAWGLMALAFKSSREGWDDRVDNTLDPGREREED
ncbi:hypothetical protein [Brevundimonas fluminis]|jgi:hypothetical protein|uniref:hypothetical protein n=1 Tax=Brevundimonas fluminis TaxID=2487274 RepID=UPI000F657411|nr:hypothetical protein [Brevundimonas fluminis]